MAALPADAEHADRYREVIRRGRRATASEGAFVGGPMLVFAPFAFCAALLRQSRTVLELAALDGRDPTDEERAAELLVLQGVYEDVGTARAALTAQRPPPPVRRLRLTTPWDLTWRMARLLGLLTPTTGRSRWWAQAGRLLLTCTVILVGTVAPLVWLPYLAVSYDRATDRLSRWP